MKKIYWFILLLGISFCLNLVNLGKNPTLIADEASIGYNAYSILKTGRDEWGNLLPLTFKAFGEHKLPLYIYFSILPIWIWGLGAFSTRFVSAFFGAFSCIWLFLLSENIVFNKKKSSFFSFLVLGLFILNPWHIQSSRMALESNLALFFFLGGLFFFQKERFFFAVTFWAATFYTYNGYRVFIPLYLLLALILGEINLKKIWRPISWLVILILPLLFSGFRGSGERFSKVGIFADPGIVVRIEEKRVICQKRLNPGFCRLVYNRPIVYTSEIFKNYLSHFSPNFLFLKGAGMAQYGLPKTGGMYLFQLPFWFGGLAYFLSHKGERRSLLPWLVAAPIATSFTGVAHPVRSLILMPLIPILTALGVVWFLKVLKKFEKIFLIIFLMAGLVSFLVFWGRYFGEYPYQTGSIWQGGYQRLFDYLSAEEQSYDRAVVTKFYGEPHIFYLFYRRIDPNWYENSLEVARYDRNDHWVNVDQVGKYYFWEKADQGLESFLSMKGQRVLIALSPTEAEPDKIPKKLIFYKNGEVAFRVYEEKAE